MFDTQYASRLFVGLLCLVFPVSLPTHAEQVKDSADSITIGKGKWRCSYQPGKICQWGEDQPKTCFDEENLEADTELLSNDTSWVEMDLDAKPIKLFFCSETGCATGSIEVKDKPIVLSILGGLLGYEGVFGMHTTWTAVFPVEINVDVMLGLSWFMVRVREAGLFEPDGTYSSVLTIVHDTTVSYSRGQCSHIDRLSKSGNPFDLILDENAD